LFLLLKKRGGYDVDFSRDDEAGKATIWADDYYKLSRTIARGGMNEEGDG